MGILVLGAQRLALIQWIGITILLTIGLVIISGSNAPRFIPRVVVLMFVLAGAAYLNVKVLVKSSLAQSIGLYTTWGIVFMLAYMLIGLILLIPVYNWKYLILYFKYAVLFGLGLGLGFKTKDWLVSRLRPDRT